jgi:acetylornithine/succinyldiaminopimelate/putrescine aminotransferase
LALSFLGATEKVRGRVRGPFAPEIYRMPFGDVAGPEKLHGFFIKNVNPEVVAAVEPAADEAKQLTSFCLENSLLLLACGSYGNIIRVLVPFVITDEQLEVGLGIFEEGLKDISN